MVYLFLILVLVPILEPDLVSDFETYSNDDNFLSEIDSDDFQTRINYDLRRISLGSSDGEFKWE